MKNRGLFFPLRRFVTLRIVLLVTVGLLCQRISGKKEFRDEKNKRMNKGHGDFLGDAKSFLSAFELNFTHACSILLSKPTLMALLAL